LYFGSAVFISTVSTTTGALRAADALTVAAWIRDSLAATPGKMQDALAELEQVCAAYGLALLPCIRTMPEHGLSVTNLSRVPFALLDFGAGTPSEADLTAEPPRRQCSILLAAGRDFRLLETRRAPG
jgi:hypothetical protein